MDLYLHIYQSFAVLKTHLINAEKKYEDCSQTNRKQNKDFEEKIQEMINKNSKLNSELLDWKDRYTYLESQWQFKHKEMSNESTKELEQCKEKVYYV